MNYEDKVSEIWSHHELQNDTHNYIELVRYATLAASSHNTQPWNFKLEPNKIIILPDFSRRCPVVDPDDHHLYVSLGCATENLLLAAQASGLKGNYFYDEDTSSIHIEFEEITPSMSTLFKSIPKRHCSRTEYDGSLLSTEKLNKLKKAGQGNGVSVILITDNEQKMKVAQYVVEGNNIQFSDTAWTEELKSWIRFNEQDAIRTGDGLYGPVMGSPDVPKWLGMLFMKFGFSAKKQNEKDIHNIQSSSALAVLFSEVNDKSHWIEAGRCYQRLALQATDLGLSTAFINQPVEISTLRSKFAHYLGIDNKRPDLIIRIGYGSDMPKSLRRTVEQVLI